MINELLLEDYKNIEDIIDITTNIDKVYQELYDLEANNKKSTPKYTDNINRLYFFLFEEKEAYKKAKLTNDKCNSLSDYLLNKFNYGILKSDIETFALHNYDDRILRRILFRLSNYIKSERKASDQLKKNIKKRLSSSSFIDRFNKGKEIETYFERDLLNVSLLFVEEAIEEKQFEMIRKKLIGLKYNVSFINSYIEHDILEDLFIISSGIYLNTRWIIDMLKITLEFYEIFKNIYGIEMADYEIEELSKIRDTDYDDIGVLETSVIRISFLRASLIFLDEELIKHLREVCKKDIQNLEYQGDKISISIIDEALNKSITDKEKVKVISLTN